VSSHISGNILTSKIDELDHYMKEECQKMLLLDASSLEKDASPINSVEITRKIENLFILHRQHIADSTHSKLIKDCIIWAFIQLPFVSGSAAG